MQAMQQTGSDGVSQGETSAAASPSVRRRAIAIGAVVLLAGTIVAAIQSPRPAPLANPGVLSTDWWLYPVEQNAVRRLPRASGAIRDVFALPGTRSVWVVGDGGLVARSTDDGRTWTTQNLRANLVRRTPQATPAVRKSALPQSGFPSANPAFGRDSTLRRGVASSGGGLSPFRLVSAAFAENVPPNVERRQAPLTQARPERQQQQQQQAALYVPNVLGRTAGAAEKELVGLGLRVKVAREVSKGAPGRVIRQEPSAGSTVSRESTVTLYVSASPTENAPPTKPTNPPPATRSDSASPPANRNDSANAGDRGPDTTSRRDSTTPPAPSVDSTKFYPRLYAICFSDASRGWIVGERGTIFGTTDGGESWREVTSPVEGTLNVLACRNGAGAIAGGQLGELIRSVGDTSWDAWSGSTGTGQHQLALLPDGSVWGIQPESSRPYVTRPPLAQSSTSGARTPASSTRTENILPIDSVRSIAFASATEGFIGTATGMLTTRDAGRTWSPAACTFQTANDSVVRPIRSIVPIDARSVGALDADNRLWTTTDGWQTCAPGVSFDHGAVRVSAASPDRWYAVSNGTLLARDANGSWSALITNALFSSLAFADRTHGFAGVAGGAIARTSNGGRTWSSTVVDRDHVAPVTHIAVRTRRAVFARAGNVLYRSEDAGSTWSRYGVAEAMVTPVYFTDSLTGFGRLRDTTFLTRDDGTTWRADSAASPLTAFARLDSSTTPSVAAIREMADTARRVWGVTRHRLLAFADTTWAPVAGASRALSTVAPVAPDLAFALDSLGSLVRSADGGAQWTDVDLPQRKLPAPWYYPFLLATVGATVLVVRKDDKERTKAPERSVADILVSDRPLREGDRDILDFGTIAGGLSKFLRNTRTQPPLTIAVTGPWGTGKSSLMHLLRRDLMRRNFRTMWFNAWHHQREESLLASLLESVRVTTVPPIWTFKGVRFRIRLLWTRFSRYAIPLLVLFPVFALAVGYILQSPRERLHDLADAFSALRDFLTHDPAKPVAAAGEATRSAVPQRTVLAVIVSAIGAAVTYAKGLKAFGVNPTDLMKSAVSAGKVRSTQSTPAFRYRFSRDFREVTDALKPERLVVFIDDLDRCKPEQVLEILEAVNFLVESGDCVVVLGIDRERVTGCVAIGFKDVASVLAGMEQKQPGARSGDVVAPREAVAAGVPALRLAVDTPKSSEAIPPAAPNPAAAAAEKAKTDRQLQIDYARHYLEKLLNMEIPIPAATPEGLGNVMTNTTTSPVPPETFEQVVRRYRLPLVALAASVATVATFFIGYRGERAFSGGEAPVQATVERQATPSRPDTSALARDRRAVDPAALVVDSTLSLTAMPLDPESLPKPVVWPSVLLLLAATGALVWLLTPREANDVQDSDTFSNALRAWAPVLFEEFRTPRAAKKFLNHVRFLAMAQRPPGPRLTPAEQAFAAIKRLPIIRQVFRSMGEGVDQTDEVAAGSIPEAALVSLSVIAERYPEWLEDREFWRSDLRSYVRAKLSPVPSDLEEALRQLDKLDASAQPSPSVAPMPPFKRHQDAWTRLVAWTRS